MKKSDKNTVKKYATYFVYILIATAGWRVYKIFNTGADELMNKLGIEGAYMPDIMIFVAVFAVILVAHKLGVKMGVGSAAKKMLKV